MRQLSLLTVPAVLLSIAAPAAADVSVVPPGQKIAGRSYAQWQVAWWQGLFARPTGTSPCPSASAGPVLFLFGVASGKPQSHTCSVPEDKPIYVPGIGLECSTLEKAPFHGSTAAQLKACAKRLWGGQKVTMSATLDGQDIPNVVTRYTIATEAFAIRLPAKNILQSKKRSGRSAAKGVGLIFTGMSAGQHTLHVTGRLPKAHFKGEVTYTLNVR
ncbi:MAG: hypothetical protein E6G10_21785 [Actinobacteria bacterium]|nr:MAG: hypothetical protein E6G10_21785 [Actinomycetota bacterium]